MPSRPKSREAALLALAGAGAIAGWGAILAAGALAAQPEAVLAIGPRDAVLAADDAALLSAGTGWVALRPSRPGAVRRLYAGGAWLVLPVPGAGCVDP